MTLQAELDEAIGEVRYVLRKLEALRQKQLDQQVAPPSVIAGPLSFLEVRRDRLAGQLRFRHPQEEGEHHARAVLTHASCTLTNCGGRCGICDDEPPGAAA